MHDGTAGIESPGSDTVTRGGWARFRVPENRANVSSGTPAAGTIPQRSFRLATPTTEPPVRHSRAGARAGNFLRRSDRNGIVSVAALLLMITVIRSTLDPDLPANPTYVLYASTILVAGLLGGVRYALLSTASSLLISVAFFGDWGTINRERVPLLLLASTCALAGVGLRASLQKRRAEHLSAQMEHAALSLELLAGSAPDVAICMLDRSGRVVHWSSGAERILGWEQRDVLGREPPLLGTLAKPASLGEWLGRIGHAGTVRELGRCERRDGSVFSGQLTVRSIVDASDTFCGYGVVIRELTAEHRAEQAFRTRDMQLRSILAAVPDATILVDGAGRIELFSPAASRLFGFDEGDILGVGWARLLVSPWREQADDLIAELLTSADNTGNASRRVIAIRRDGTIFPAQITLGTAIAGARNLFTVSSAISPSRRSRGLRWRPSRSRCCTERG